MCCQAIVGLCDPTTKAPRLLSCTPRVRGKEEYDAASANSLLSPADHVVGVVMLRNHVNHHSVPSMSEKEYKYAKQVVQAFIENVGLAKDSVRSQSLYL